MYQINLSVTHGEAGSSLVRLEVEQLDSQSHDRWHGEFTSQCKLLLSAKYVLYVCMWA